MPGQIKVSGTWRTAGSALVKVSGSWRSVTSGWVKVGGVWKQWFIGLITDTFTRTTSGSLGTANTGQSWTSKFGVWYANGSQAQSDAGTSANTAGAVAVVDIGNPNATVSLGNSAATGVNPGTGVAFWSTAAGSWWGAVSYSDQTTSFVPSDYGPIYTSYSGTASSSCTGTAVSCSDSTNTCNPGGCGAVSVSSVGTYSCNNSRYPYFGYNGFGQAVCYFYTDNGDNIPATLTGNTYTRTQNTTVTTYTCNSGDSGGGSSSTCTNTTYGYRGTQQVTSTNYYLQVLYSLAGGAAYTVQSTNTTASEVKSINVSTSGNNYSVTAYNSSYGSLGTWSGTNSGTKGTQHGIVKAYSSYAQGSTADNFSAQGQ
jgi:hypothetical protein